MKQVTYWTDTFWGSSIDPSPVRLTCDYRDKRHALRFSFLAEVANRQGWKIGTCLDLKIEEGKLSLVPRPGGRTIARWTKKPEKWSVWFSIPGNQIETAAKMLGVSDITKVDRIWTDYVVEGNDLVLDWSRAEVMEQAAEEVATTAPEGQ